MKIIYVVGRFYAQTTSSEYGVKTAWNIMGVYESEDEAKRNCLHENDFVGPMELNKPSTEDDHSKPWPGCYYPLNKE